MKKLIVVTQLLALGLAGCNTGGIRGNGQIATEQNSIASFCSLKVDGAFDVDWHPGAVSSSVTTDENLMQFVEIRVTGNVLHTHTTRSVRPSHSIKLVVSSPSLESASFSGASRFSARQLAGPKLYLETSGASRATLDGNVGELLASMTGASDLRAESLQVRDATLSLTGAADARVNVSGTLKVAITGAGKVDYSGNPSHVERHITGAGTIRKRE